METPKLSTLIYDLPQEDYHAIKNTFSSSQLKDLLDDEELFYDKHIAKTQAKEHVDAFDVGTYFHTGILEPHKLKKECVIYPNRIRRGADWELFKKNNKGKAILTLGMEKTGKALIEAVKKSPISMARIKRGRAEVSLFVQICVHEGQIYAVKEKKILKSAGWENFKGVIPSAKSGAVYFILKVRADSLGNDFILDLKSTSGNAKSPHTMRQKISYYNYDLSASLYLDLFSLPLGVQLTSFIWTFASKDKHNARSYKASIRNVLVGRAKWKKAVLALADGIANDWEMQDYLGTLEPQHFELEYIETNYDDIF